MRRRGGQHERARDPRIEEVVASIGDTGVRPGRHLGVIGCRGARVSRPCPGVSRCGAGAFWPNATPVDRRRRALARAARCYGRRREHQDHRDDRTSPHARRAYLPRERGGKDPPLRARPRRPAPTTISLVGYGWCWADRIAVVTPASRREIAREMSISRPQPLQPSDARDVRRKMGDHRIGELELSWPRRRQRLRGLRSRR